MNIDQNIRKHILKRRLTFYERKILGLDLNSQRDLSLEKACIELNKPLEALFKALKADIEALAFDFKAIRLQAPDKIIRYLNNCHKDYLNNRLPFVQSTITQLRRNFKGLALLGRDFEQFRVVLKRQIELEENTLFSYINDLQNLALDFSSESYEIFHLLNRYKLDEYEINQDNTLYKFFAGLDLQIREYVLKFDDELQKDIILTELKAFSIDLESHNVVEQEILLPKARILETELNNRIEQMCVLN